MTVPAFDYDYWRDGDAVRASSAWRDAGLHWHGHVWRGSGADYGNEQSRRDLSTDLPPKVLTDWLSKPPRTIRQVAATPDDMLTWLRTQWDEVKHQLGQEATGIDEQGRFGRALYDLRDGRTVCWGGWLGASTYWHAAAVPTATRCH